MSKTIIDINIHRPAEAVFAYLTNFENNPKWQKGMKSCKFTSEGPVGVGTTYQQVAGFLGKTIVTKLEVIEYEPNRLVKFVSRESTFPLRILRSVEPIEGGTHVHAARRRGPAASDVGPWSLGHVELGVCEEDARVREHDVPDLGQPDGTDRRPIATGPDGRPFQDLRLGWTRTLEYRGPG